MPAEWHVIRQGPIGLKDIATAETVWVSLAWFELRTQPAGSVGRVAAEDSFGDANQLTERICGKR
jgi:hypothetical protein